MFSFSQFAMWKDLDTNLAVLEENPIVRALADGVPYPSDKDIGADADPYGLCLTVSADSSQIKAVRASGEGRSFVMHGPPGTGKSQTITNMITNALYMNKTVLFVAEKRAALEVVQKRLEEVGIGNHCLELHSNKTEKSRVIEQIKSALARCPPLDDSKAQQLAREIEAVRDRLDLYARELHSTRSFGISAYEAVSRFESWDVPDAKDLAIDLSAGRCPSDSDLLDIEEAVRSAHQAYDIVRDMDSEVLRHVRLGTVAASVGGDVRDMISELKSADAEYDSCIGQLRSYGIPADLGDDARRGAFFSAMLALDAGI